MTQATNVPLRETRWNDAKIVGGVSAAHFISHFYILLLPPLFDIVRDEYDVSYTELGFALVFFNVASAALQTPAGFLVDRVSARMMLIIALVLSAAAFAVIGVVHSFWVFVAMFGIAGVANAIYHPADYALLSQHVSNPRAGQAFSIHTFAGILGGAAAPPSLLVMQNFSLLIPTDTESMSKTAASARKAAAAADAPNGNRRLLLSAPILLNLLLFTLLAFTNAGLQNYSVVALGALHDTPLALANSALTAYLLLSAFGVLLGGMLLVWTHRHALVATLGLVVSGLSAAALGLVDPGAVGLIVLMAISGLFNGAIMPSRDMLVREVTPAGSFGKVFGFVTSGFNIGGIIAPLIYGAVMDRNDPRAVFLLVGIGSLVAILTVMTRPGRAKPSDEFAA